MKETFLQLKKYLGYDFSLSGRIVHGNSIGRTLGFPTANVEVKEEYKLLPKKWSLPYPFYYRS